LKAQSFLDADGEIGCKIMEKVEHALISLKKQSEAYFKKAMCYK
jgi:hypothetical protein